MVLVHERIDSPDTPASPPRQLRVALVNSPFASARYPSIQLGLLHAILERHDIPVQTFNLNVEFASMLGWETYEHIALSRTPLLGEWLFAPSAFGEDTPPAAAYLEYAAETIDTLAADMGRDREFVLNLRETVIPQFLHELLVRFDWGAFDVVGFGSIFEQNCAALAMARLLKDRYPHLITVFGGANFEDQMGLEFVRAVPWIDYAVIGEGDEVFPALLKRLAAGEEILTMLGVARRNADGTVSFAGRPPSVRDLDALPEPNYTDYFATAGRLGLPAMLRGQPILMPFETARGCWWGDKHHCTFCGLNGMGMAFRSKTPARVRAGLDQLADQYQVYSFEAVDNIMDTRYITEVFAPLADERKDYTFFYETKVNVTQEHLRTMARGGVRRLQPGIESLSTNVLRLMRKGTTALQNVRFLKWALYYRIHTSWNIIYGFPGETETDYQQQTDIIKLIPHLQPPTGISRIWLERFSPFFMEPDHMGMINVRARRDYSLVYPDWVNHFEIAYFFDYDAPTTVSDEYHQELHALVEGWGKRWHTDNPPALNYQRGAGHLTIIDTRGEQPKVHAFDELAGRIYDFCGPTAHTCARILEHLRSSGLDAGEGEVARRMAAFISRGVMLEEDGRYLSLALPVNGNW